MLERFASNGTSSTTIIPLQHIVMDEADRLAAQTDLCQQVTSILQHCRVVLRNDNKDDDDHHPCTVALLSATLPQTVPSTWNDWLSIVSQPSPQPPPCLLLRTDDIQNQETSHNQQRIPLTVASSTAAPLSSKDCDTRRLLRHDWLSKIPSHLTQVLHVCAHHKKPKKLLTILQTIYAPEKSSSSRGLGIIFFNKIQTLQQTAQFLKSRRCQTMIPQVHVVEYHSHLDNHVRHTVLRTFASGRANWLCATDVAARGLHLDHVKYVINYDFPTNLEHYVHRCGRAGRTVSLLPDTTTTTNGTPNNDTTPKPNAQTIQSTATVYSFFTRNLAPMARDLIHLLQSCQQWVDPNLVELVNSVSAKQDTSTNKTVQTGPKPPTFRNRFEKQTFHNGTESPLDNDDDDDDDVAFDHLSARRIVLQRAKHLKYDSSSSSSNDDDEDDDDK